METIAFSVGNDVTPPCLIMERMHESLFDRLKSTIDFPEALGIVLDVCKVRVLYLVMQEAPCCRRWLGVVTPSLLVETQESLSSGTF